MLIFWLHALTYALHVAWIVTSLIHTTNIFFGGVGLFLFQSYDQNNIFLSWQSKENWMRVKSNNVTKQPFSTPCDIWFCSCRERPVS